MSKKMKRTNRPVVSTTTAPQTTTVVSTPTTSGRSFEREFNPDYTPVIKDLRRIGTLAGSFFVVLVVLSFFLR